VLNTKKLFSIEKQNKKTISKKSNSLYVLFLGLLFLFVHLFSLFSAKFILLYTFNIVKVKVKVNRKKFFFFFFCGFFVFSFFDSINLILIYKYNILNNK